MSSQFDDLLGDLGESSSSPAASKTTTGANNGLDDFDPFGPAQPAANGNSELLLDFSAGAEVKNGDFSQSANPLYDEFSAEPTNTTTDSTNPLYDAFAEEPLATTSNDNNQSSDLLGDFSNEPQQQQQQQPPASANPLYDDFSGEQQQSQSANPLYDDSDFTAEPMSQNQSQPAAANPLYEEFAEEEPVESSPGQQQEQQEEDQVEDRPAMDLSDQLQEVDRQVLDMSEQQQEQEEEEAGQELNINEMPPQVCNGHPKDWFGENYQAQEESLPEPEQQQEQQQFQEEEEEQTQQQQQELPDIPIVEVTASPGKGGGRDEVEALEEREEEEAAKALAAQAGSTEGPTEAVAQDEDEEDTGLEREHQPLPDLVVREPGDQEVDDGTGEQEEELALEDVGGAGVGAELESPEAEYAHYSEEPQEQQQEDPHHHYGHDRREEDLEQYCLDREDSDIPDETSVTPPGQVTPVTSLPATEEEPQQQQLPVEDLEEDGGKASAAKDTVSDSSLDRRNAQPAEEPTSNNWEDSQNKENVSRQAEHMVSEPTSPPARTISSSSSSRMEPKDARIGLEDGDDEEEEGVYENEPEQRDDVIREADRDPSLDLPAAGTASSMKARFMQDVETASAPSPRTKREITPPAHGTGGEYVSEPRAVLEHYEAKPDAGVFESPEPTRNPEVVSAYDVAEEALPEQGLARNMAARFKDLEAQNSSPASSKREITPPAGGDAGPTEYVSEPRGPGVEQYEVKVDAGVFESQPQVNPDVVHSGEAVEEALPEAGTAKNMMSRYLQLTEESKSPPSATKAPKEIVVANTETRVEYENEPQRNPDVVTSDTQVEEFVPQRGFAKNLASRFKELESNAKSPPDSPGRHVKEFTPPREADQPTVRESKPAEQNPEVVHSGDMLEEALPEKGTAKNMMQRFKQLEAESKSPTGPTRAKKEFTPPPGEAGVYENTPKSFQADYNKPAESGIVENQPVQREDVSRGDEPPKYEEELPERGAAKNLVSKWRQLESESAKSAKSPGSRPKEFTPPRDEPRLATRKSPRTPMSPGGDGGSNGSVHPSELPGQYQPQQGESVFESTPEQTGDDVLREGERDYAADLPKKNTAKKMLARFQSFQEKANQGSGDPGAGRQDSQNSIESDPDPEPEPEPEPAMESARSVFEDPAQIGRSKSMRAAIQLEKCAACDKTVYAMERLENNKTVYHKACFRCSVCRSVLTPKTYANNNGVIFCTNHFKQLFATKGNYDEGFGRQQHKKRWNSNPNLADDGEENGINGTQNGHSQQQQQHTVAAANS